MKGYDWFFGFLAGVLLIVIEVGYLAHCAGLNIAISRWIEEQSVAEASTP